MKQFMIDMMIMMMPVMKPLVWLGFALVIVGAILMVMRQILDDKNGSMVLLAGRILLGLAGFFLACQVAGTFLGMPPKINFGDFEKMEFILVPFWQIGLGFLIAALIYGFVGGRRHQELEVAKA